MLRVVRKIIENEKKEQNGGFLRMSLGALGALGAGLLGNMLAGKGFLRTNFEIRKFYRNEPTITHKIFETNYSFHVK